MKWRDDFATIALFMCFGPFVGMIVYGVIVDGLTGMLAPFGFLVIVAIARLLGLLAILVFGCFPAAVSAASGLLMRRLGRPNLFIPASVCGSLLAVLCLDFGFGVAPSGRLYLVAALTSVALASLDLLIRRVSPAG